MLFFQYVQLIDNLLRKFSSWLLYWGGCSVKGLETESVMPESRSRKSLYYSIWVNAIQSWSSDPAMGRTLYNN